MLNGHIYYKQGVRIHEASPELLLSFHDYIKAKSVWRGVVNNPEFVNFTLELCWKFYKTKKEVNEGQDGEDAVGWGRHLVCRPVTDA